MTLVPNELVWHPWCKECCQKQIFEAYYHQFHKNAVAAAALLESVTVKTRLKGYLQSMSIRIINNFKLMVLRAQTELGALLWICFTPKYMLLIFVRFFFDFFFAENFSDFFSPKIFLKQIWKFFPTKIFGRLDFFLEKKQKYRSWSKTYPKESS